MKAVAWVLAGYLMLAAFGLKGFSGGPLAELQPVQLLTVQQLPRGIAVYTDNGLSGMGETYELAMRQLEASAPGKAFFASCGAVVLCGGVQSLQEVCNDTRLRPAARIYCAAETPDAAALQPILAAHPEGAKIADLVRGMAQPSRLIPTLGGWQVEDVS